MLSLFLGFLIWASGAGLSSAVMATVLFYVFMEAEDNEARRQRFRRRVIEERRAGHRNRFR